MRQTNCSTCAHNNACNAVRVADVVECREYQPRCKACAFYTSLTDSKGTCPMMAFWIGCEDSCTLGDPK